MNVCPLLVPLKHKLIIHLTFHIKYDQRQVKAQGQAMERNPLRKRKQKGYKSYKKSSTKKIEIHFMRKAQTKRIQTP